MNDLVPPAAARRAARSGQVKDGLFDLGIRAAAWFLLAALLALLLDLAVQGLGHLSWDFLVSAPRASGRAGGIAPILVSTLALVLIALAVALPLGLATAVWLVEFTRLGGPAARALRLSLDVLAGVPSIVFGLAGHALFGPWLGHSLLAGGLTLACMILPLLIRSAEAGLQAVDPDWRRGAAALGLRRSTALRHVLLPAAAPALLAGVMLGLGRATAETAALLFTSGYADRMPASLLDSGRSLAVHIYELSMNVTGGDRAAQASALVLVALILVLNLAALRASDRWVRRRLGPA